MQKKPSLRERRKQPLEALEKSIKKLSPIQAKMKAISLKDNMPPVHSAPLLDPQNILDINAKEKARRGSTAISNRSQSGNFINSSEDEGYSNITQQKTRFDDKYDLMEKIGEGAHGVVSKCISKEKGKLYAVKTLRWEDQHFRSLKMNFINIKQLNHKSLIKYRSLFLNEKLRVCHTVLEYFPHPPLKPKTLDEDQLRIVFAQILGALAYLHKHNICHRDIKPDNILYDKQKKQIKIIDFGVSKNVKLRGRYEKMLTDTGTFYYKAPEMFLGQGYSQSVDSWAAGILLYQMITGQTPFASQYLIETKENILNSEINFSNQQFYFYKPIVKDLITHLLKKSPKDRISCKEAQKHLWFHSHVEDHQMMQSAEFKLQKIGSLNRQINNDGLTSWVIKRKDSLKAQSNQEPSPMSVNDKFLRKAWLETINQTNPGHTEDVVIDFVDSDDDFSFELPMTPQPEVNLTSFGFAKPFGALNNKDRTFSFQ